jgi:hypothetical protein
MKIVEQIRHRQITLNYSRPYIQSYRLCYTPYIKLTPNGLYIISGQSVMVIDPKLGIPLKLPISQLASSGLQAATVGPAGNEFVEYRLVAVGY